MQMKGCTSHSLGNMYLIRAVNQRVQQSKSLRGWTKHADGEQLYIRVERGRGSTRGGGERETWRVKWEDSESRWKRRRKRLDTSSPSMKGLESTALDYL